MTQYEAFYLPRGDGEFDSTPATSSPWDLTAQHGGPPAALLGRAMENATSDPDLTFARVTIDMLGPIPQGRIRTEAGVVRAGRRVQLVQGQLYADDVLAVTATAWQIRRTEASTAEVGDQPAELPALPEHSASSFFVGVPDDWGYGNAVDWRFATGGFDAGGRAGVWTRARIPLVAGEEQRPVERLLLVADSANGLSVRLPIDQWWSIPPTLTATIQSLPVGEWVWMDAVTTIGADGRGIATATMADESGLLAEVAQPLMVARR